MGYYRAEGDVLLKAIALLQRCSKAMRAMMDFSKEHGGTGDIFFAWSVYASFTIGGRPDPKVWRQNPKDLKEWVPRTSRKRGKAIYKQMEAICKQHPSLDELSELLGYELIKDGVIRRPGLRIHNEFVYFELHDHYIPVENVVKCTDFEFETGKRVIAA